MCWYIQIYMSPSTIQWNVTTEQRGIHLVALGKTQRTPKAHKHARTHTHCEEIDAHVLVAVLVAAAVVAVAVVVVATLPHCDFNCVQVTKMNHHKSEHIPMFISIMCHIRIANARAKIT